MAKVKGFGTTDPTKRTKPKRRKADAQQLNCEEISRNLDAIFKTRTGGAVNIWGIRYQILYSLLSAFELYEQNNSTATLRLEGIEDVDHLDLVGFQYRSEYIQVKSANKSWNWAKLKEPLEKFLEVSRTDANCGFATLSNKFCQSTRLLGCTVRELKGRNRLPWLDYEKLGQEILELWNQGESSLTLTA